ncbi:FT-interacting protein 1 [Bienertia sinuspersici]
MIRLRQRGSVGSTGHEAQANDYKQKEEANPQLGQRWPNGGGFGGKVWMNGGEKFSSTYDLVEQTYYLYVRVVKAKDLPHNGVTGGCDPYVEVKLGNYKGRTKQFENKRNPEWEPGFRFPQRTGIQASTLEVFLKEREMVGRDDYVGRVVFDLNEVPTRVH